MKESSDRAQEFLDAVYANFGTFQDNNGVEVKSTRFEGEMHTLGGFDSSLLSHQGDIQDIASNVDAEIMDEVYRSARNNTDGPNTGYNKLRGLNAVEKGVPPAMITGAKPETVEEWLEDFRDVGLTYPTDQGEELTTEGEFFTEEAYHFMDRIGNGKDDREAEERLGNIFSHLSRKYDNQGEKLHGFLLMAETDNSITDIADTANTTRRTAYNWINEWSDHENGGVKLFHGEPSDRELTSLGKATYNMIGNHYQRMDALSEMKAEVITHLDEEDMSEEQYFIPGNQDMVTQYLRNDSLADKYMTQE